MADQTRSFAILVGSLEPSEELASVIELLTWLRSARPDLHALVVARTGGGWADRVDAIASVERLDLQPASKGARLLQQARLEPIARQARAAATRRLLRLGPMPVVVETSGEPSRPWLDPTAGPVITHHHRSTGDADVTDDADLPDLWPQGDGRDDAPEALARWAASRPGAAGPVAAHVAIVGPEGSVVPDDTVLGVIWSTVEHLPGTRFDWIAPSLADPARTAVEAQLRDSGLSTVVEVVDDSDLTWRAVSAADAVLALRPDPSLALAEGRVVDGASHDGADRSTQVLAEALARVLDREVGHPRPDPPALASAGGPRWLAALGLG